MHEEKKAKLRRERKRKNEIKAKTMTKLQLGMTAPTDLDMEDRALAGEEMFDLGEGERELARAGARDIGDAVRDADGMSESEEEVSAEIEEDDEVLSSDEEREARLAELEGDLDGLYDDYKERMAERDAKWKVKQERLRDRNFDSWHGIKDGEESDDGVDKGYRDGMVRVPRRGDADEEEEESEGEGGWDVVAAQKAKLGEEVDSDDSDEEGEEVKPKKKSKITIRPTPAIERAERTGLLTSLSGDGRAEMSRQAQVWFDQGVFKDVGDLAALDGDDESEEDEEDEEDSDDEDEEEEDSEDDEEEVDEDGDVDMAGSLSSTLEGEEEDDEFEIVPQEVDDEPEWDVDDEDQDEVLQKNIKCKSDLPSLF